MRSGSTRQLAIRDPSTMATSVASHGESSVTAPHENGIRSKSPASSSRRDSGKLHRLVLIFSWNAGSIEGWAGSFDGSAPENYCRECGGELLNVPCKTVAISFTLMRQRRPMCTWNENKTVWWTVVMLVCSTVRAKPSRAITVRSS